MAPVAVPIVEELSLTNGKQVKEADQVNGEDVDEDEDEELDGGEPGITGGKDNPL